MNSRILTHDKLVELDACASQREKFLTIFGEQVEVSVERFSQPDVIAARFDFDWAADVLLQVDQREDFYRQARKRRQALMEEHRVVWYVDVPKDARYKMTATLWAEFYVASATPAEELSPPEFPKVEESVSGN